MWPGQPHKEELREAVDDELEAGVPGGVGGDLILCQAGDGESWHIFSSSILGSRQLFRSDVRSMRKRNKYKAYLVARKDIVKRILYRNGTRHSAPVTIQVMRVLGYDELV